MTKKTKAPSAKPAPKPKKPKSSSWTSKCIKVPKKHDKVVNLDIADTMFEEHEEEVRQPKIMGRPTAYKPEFVAQAKKLAKAGFTDMQMADFFEVSRATFYNWTAEHKDFLDAIKMQKEGPDECVTRSLYHRARGYEWTEQQSVKVKGEDGIERVEVVPVRRHVPPDSTAAIFWLKNRRGWRDRQEVEHDVSDNLSELLKAIDGKTQKSVD